MESRRGTWQIELESCRRSVGRRVSRLSPVDSRGFELGVYTEGNTRPDSAHFAPATSDNASEPGETIAIPVSPAPRSADVFRSRPNRRPDESVSRGSRARHRQSRNFAWTPSRWVRVLFQVESIRRNCRLKELLALEE